jgi:hypothetical protein
LREIEEDDAWERSKRSKPKHGRNLEESKRQAAQETSGTEGTGKSIKDELNYKAPTGFY